jgi:hypothetical protein
MNTKYQYIRFLEEHTTGKTSKWSCLNNKSDDCLGMVRWDGGWRQYVFWPEDCCMFSNGCLRDIADFLDQLNAKQKAKTT